MKTLRVSDAAHRELTRLLGEMMAQSGKTQTYNDVISARALIILNGAELFTRMDQLMLMSSGTESMMPSA